MAEIKVSSSMLSHLWLCSRNRNETRSSYNNWNASLDHLSMVVFGCSFSLPRSALIDFLCTICLFFRFGFISLSLSCRCLTYEKADSHTYDIIFRFFFFFFHPKTENISKSGKFCRYFCFFSFLDQIRWCKKSSHLLKSNIKSK